MPAHTHTHTHSHVHILSGAGCTNTYFNKLPEASERLNTVIMKHDGTYYLCLPLKDMDTIHRRYTHGPTKRHTPADRHDTAEPWLRDYTWQFPLATRALASFGSRLMSNSMEPSDGTL